jgi:hypothetical protein
MSDNNLHETSMTSVQPLEKTLEKTTRSRGRPSFAEKAEPTLRDTFSLEVMKGILASGVAVEDPLALSRHCYKIADALVKVREE